MVNGPGVYRTTGYVIVGMWVRLLRLDDAAVECRAREDARAASLEHRGFHSSGWIDSGGKSGSCYGGGGCTAEYGPDACGDGD